MYDDLDVGAVLDQLPTVVIADEDIRAYTSKTEIYQKGLNMLINGHGGYIQLLLEGQ